MNQEHFRGENGSGQGDQYLCGTVSRLLGLGLEREHITRICESYYGFRGSPGGVVGQDCGVYTGGLFTDGNSGYICREWEVGRPSRLVCGAECCNKSARDCDAVGGGECFVGDIHTEGSKECFPRISVSASPDESGRRTQSSFNGTRVENKDSRSGEELKNVNLSKRQLKRKRQKNRGSVGAMSSNWCNRDGGDMIKQDQTPGTFWNSTSKQVRQELIDSKAKMHIAENKRREREALDKIAYLESPEAAMHKAIGMIDYAQKQAKKENDNKVYGWAKTVATSSAESLARSTPDSVPSFDEVSARIEASSQSSFELELKAKQDELDDERRKNALLENEIREEKKAKEEVVAKSKHEAVVHRMRQLETQISENNKKAERVNFRSNRVEEMRNAQGETEKQMRARMAKLSPEEHQREVVRLMRERAWENS